VYQTCTIVFQPWLKISSARLKKGRKTERKRERKNEKEQERFVVAPQRFFFCDCSILNFTDQREICKKFDNAGFLVGSQSVESCKWGPYGVEARISHTQRSG